MTSPNICIPIDTLTLCNGLVIDIARLDRIHPTLSGNKWFKLMPNVSSLAPGATIASFGGAHSNHIHALAYACSQLNVSSVGVIRGEPQLTPTLIDAKEWGMRLYFVDRQSYRDKRFSKEGSDEWCWLPEGGSNALAVKGCAHILSSMAKGVESFDRIYTAVGSGATLAGLIYSAPLDKTVIGISALGGVADLKDRVASLLAELPEKKLPQWHISHGSELRYGKINAALASLWTRASQLGLDLDPIYTLRVLERILLDYRSGHLSGQRVLMLHTGGLQGIRAQQDRISRLASNFIGPQPL